MDREPDNKNSKGAQCCCLAIIWMISASIGITFLSLNSLQTGRLYYSYTAEFYSTPSHMTNKFTCGYSTIVLDCSNYGNFDDICWQLQGYSPYANSDLIFKRNKVDPSYDQQYANIWFICASIACIIPYIVTALIFLISPSINKKSCGLAQKHKCLILCFLSMIASIFAVILGINLYDDHNCTDGLEDYIAAQIGSQWDDNYKWDKEATTNYGVTLYFMMVNCGVTFIFVSWCCQCIVCPTKYQKDPMESNRMREYKALNEGKEEDVAMSVDRYGSAKAAKASVNALEFEGC